jgi:CRP-like cAMP-binding protein
MYSLHKNLTPLARAQNSIDPNLLQQIPYFESVFKDRSLWPILTRLSGKDGIAHIKLRVFKPGERIIAEGKFDQMIYWIIKGSANVISLIKGHAKIIHKSERGECLGELGVLRGAPRKNDVIAGHSGATAIEVDWAITGKSPELGKSFFTLLTLHMADKLDKSYSKHIKIINNAMNMIHEKTTTLVEKNRSLAAILAEHGIDAVQTDISDEEALSHAISNIKESLDLLQHQENYNNLKELGTWFELKLPDTSD